MSDDIKKDNGPAKKQLKQQQPQLSRSLGQEMIDGFNKESNNKDEAAVPTSDKTVLKALFQEQDGDAYLLIKLFQDRYLYDNARGHWYYYNDHYWRFDELNHATTLIKDVIRLYKKQQYYEEYHLTIAEQENNETKIDQHEYIIKQIKKRVKKLQTLRYKKDIMALSILGKNSLGWTGTAWDTKPMLFGCKNGVLDFDEMLFRPGQPTDYIKTISPICWEALDTPCPQWEKFLLQMFNHDQSVVDYIQRLLGYGITGLNTEHVFPIFWGSEGRNGKGTLFETLKYILGDFAYKAPSDFLITQGMKGNNSSSPDAVMAGLFGKRIVWCSETNEKDRLDVAKLKELVGGDTISARFPYAKRQIEFSPTHLLLIITNMRPKVPANDSSLWQRIHLIPLKNSFVESPDPNKPYEFKADKKLLSKLKKEASGILAWLVKGCFAWQREGLSPPNSINTATKEYRKNEDIIGDFIQECCFSDDYVEMRVKTTDLYAAYKVWCDDVGHRAMSKKRFFDDVKKRFEKTKSHGVRYFINIGLKEI